MERRKFLKSTALASTMPLLFNHIPVMASSDLESSNLQQMALAAANCGKILVIIQMNGGNDGLNTVFPLDKWDDLQKSRANILMDQKQVLPLKRNDTTGLHPAMPEMKKLYDEGKMMIVQGVSYPNPSYSHFRSTDIWFTASDSDKSLTSGWLGRSLNELYPGFPIGYPNNSMPDPLAIQIGSTLPFSLQGPSINMAYSVPKPEDLINVINETIDLTPDTDYKAELRFLKLMKDQSNNYREAIQKAYQKTKPNTVTYPVKNALADQLQIVAKLINGGLQTPIYVVNHPDGFDTHENQVLETDKTLGRQAKNLKILSQAIGAFQEDLKVIGKSKIVSGMTFSEFGRRIKSNDSMGTDHGSAAPVLFFGDMLNTGTKKVKDTLHPVSGMIGKSPVLPINPDVNENLPMQFDFRQIYATIMQDWLCLSESQTTKILGKSFEKLPIFGDGNFLNDDVSAVGNFFSVYPNPVFNNSPVNVVFNSVLNTNVALSLYSMAGQKVFGNEFFVANDQLIFQANSLSSGTYIVEIIFNLEKYFKKLIVL
jgi:uncharacterized protein (DUF1501 family)